MSGEQAAWFDGFRVPAAAPLPRGQLLVAQFIGVDFEGLLSSPDFDFVQPFDASFGKMMIRTASHLLGGDACGTYGYVERLGFSVGLEPAAAEACWQDLGSLLGYLIGLASSKMSLEVDDEALFGCSLFSFPGKEQALAYFSWRQQEAFLGSLNRYCTHVLSQRGDRSPEVVEAILSGLEPPEKEEILRQNEIEYRDLPAWQRYGAAVFLTEGGKRVSVETRLPRGPEYADFLKLHLG